MTYIYIAKTQSDSHYDLILRAFESEEMCDEYIRTYFHTSEHPIIKSRVPFTWHRNEYNRAPCMWHREEEKE